MDFCPWCGREFEKIDHFYAIRILNSAVEPCSDEGIKSILNESEPVKKYMEFIRNAKGSLVVRSKFLPNLKRDPEMEDFYQIPGFENYYLKLDSSENKKTLEKIAEIFIYSKDSKLSTAKETILAKPVKVGEIKYEGVLNFSMI